MRKLGGSLLAIVFLTGEIASAQWGAGIYGGYQPCPYPMTVGSGAYSASDELFRIKSEQSSAKRRLATAERKLKRVEEKIKKSRKKISDAISKDIEMIIYEQLTTNKCYGSTVPAPTPAPTPAPAPAPQPPGAAPAPAPTPAPVYGEREEDSAFAKWWKNLNKGSSCPYTSGPYRGYYDIDCCEGATGKWANYPKCTVGGQTFDKYFEHVRPYSQKEKEDFEKRTSRKTSSVSSVASRMPASTDTAPGQGNAQPLLIQQPQEPQDPCAYLNAYRLANGGVNPAICSDSNYTRGRKGDPTACREALEEDGLPALIAERTELKVKISELKRDIDRLDDEYDDEKDRIRDAAETEGGIDVVYGGSYRKPSTGETVAGLATTVLGGLLAYKGYRYAVDHNAQLGWPTSPAPAVGAGLTMMMGGLYGGAYSGIGGGAYGCGGPMGGPGSMGMGGAFGYPYGFMGQPMGGGMYMPGMHPGMMGGMPGMMYPGMGNGMGWGMGPGMLPYPGPGGGMGGFPMGGGMGGFPMGGGMGGFPMGGGMGGFPMGGGMGGFPMGGGMMGGMPGMGGMFPGGGIMNPQMNMQMMQMQQAYMQQQMQMQQAAIQDYMMRQQTVMSLSAEINRLQMQVYQISMGGGSGGFYGGVYGGGGGGGVIGGPTGPPVLPYPGGQSSAPIVPNSPYPNAPWNQQQQPGQFVPRTTGR